MDQSSLGIGCRAAWIEFSHTALRWSTKAAKMLHLETMKRIGAPVLIILLCLAGLYAQGSGEVESVTPASVRNTGISSTLAELNSLYQFLQANSYYDMDTDVLEENLTKALMASLDDPYAEYIADDMAEDFSETVSGTYVGIGIYLTKYDPMFIDWEDETTYMINVTSTFPGGPADRAGLEAKDLISHINGEAVYQMDANEASDLLKGEEGVPITITVHRKDVVFDLTLVPQEVVTPSVMYTMLDGTSIGYIMIPSFASTTYTLVSQALTSLTDQGMESLVIDLRNNSGGTVDTACLVANFFTDTGDTVLNIEYKEGSGRNDTRLVSSDQTRKYRIPLALLVDGGTASASEILAAALQDNGKATIIGTQTFGKGIMQDIFPWADGYVRYTSSHYLTPDGNDIHEVGITPDIIVQEPEMTEEQMEEYYSFVSEHADDINEWIVDNEEYCEENIQAFSDRYSSEISFDPLYLRLLIRNEYIYSMDFDDRPVADPVYDICLRTAVDHLEGR